MATDEPGGTGKEGCSHAHSLRTPTFGVPARMSCDRGGTPVGDIRVDNRGYLAALLRARTAVSAGRDQRPGCLDRGLGMVGPGRRRRPPRRCRGPRPGAAEALDPAQLPGAGSHALPAGGHPPGAAAVLHRAQLRRPSATTATPAPRSTSGRRASRRSSRSAPSATSTRSATSTSCTRPRPVDAAGARRRGCGSVARTARSPYDMALLNVSAMSFGALSANALDAR